MTNKDLANVIFPNITKTIEDYDKEYPKRNLPEGACVTRFAPSPTGFLHLGGLFQAIINYVIAGLVGLIVMVGGITFIKKKVLIK